MSQYQYTIEITVQAPQGSERPDLLRQIANRLAESDLQMRNGTRVTVDPDCEDDSDVYPAFDVYRIVLNATGEKETNHV